MGRVGPDGGTQGIWSIGYEVYLKTIVEGKPTILVCGWSHAQ